MSVNISKERYEELLRAETVRDILVDVAQQETADYRMAEMTRLVLKPYMRPQLVEGGVPYAE